MIQRNNRNTHSNYVPSKGDIVYVEINDGVGHEQKGTRPVVVLTTSAYNEKTGLMNCVPITNQVKGYPFEVAIDSVKATGVALADQMKCFDWKARNANYYDKASDTVIDQILELREALLSANEQ